MKLSRTLIAPLGLCGLMLIATTGCTPYWTGSQMQADIEALRAEQTALVESMSSKEAELTEMIASARGEVDELNRVLREATALLQRNNADFGVEMERLRQEVENLRGMLEEQEFRLAKMEQELRYFKEDVDMRFASGGGVKLPEKADELYQFAVDKVGEESYPVARRALESFISKHGSDRRVPDAIYLLGETFFKEGQWVSAVVEYQKILKDHASSKRAADATFRIGQSFVKLGRCDQAKIFFESVVADHGGSRLANDAKRELKAIDAGKCG